MGAAHAPEEMSGRRALGTAAFAVLAAVGCQALPVVPVRSMDIDVRVHPDGALEVREAIVVGAPSAGRGGLVRRVPGERVESLSIGRVSVNGRPVQPEGEALPSVTIRDSHGLEVGWELAEATAATPLTLEWSYRAEGALAIRGARGSLRHVLLPAGRSFAAGHVRVRLAVPPTLHLFEGTGIAEAGWTVSRTGDGILAERRDLPAGEPVTIVAELGVDPAGMAEPAWQRYEEWARQLVPAFVSGGLFILTIGAGVLWILRFQYPRRRASEADRQERDAVRRGLRATGVAALALAAVLAVVTWAALVHFGVWAQAIAVSVAAVGVMFLAVAKRIV